MTDVSADPATRDETAAEQTRPAGPRRVLSRLWPVLAIVAVVLLANAVFLLGLTESDSAAVLAGITADLQPGVLPGRSTLDPNSGTTLQAMGQFAAQEWLDGRVPWWNPYQGLGMPLAGNMQSAAFFPTTLLLALDSGELYQRMLLEVVSGLATFWLCRRLGLRPWVAVLAGAVFALNGTSSWFHHTAALPVPFLPLLLLGLERARDSALRRAWGGVAVIAVALALSLYAGFPETAFLNGVLAGVWFLARVPWSSAGRAAGYVARVGVGAVVGLGLAAPVLLAFAVSLAESGAEHVGWSGVSLTAGVAAPQLLLPYAYGPPLAFFGSDLQLYSMWASTGGYLTAGLVVLALLGALGRRHRGLRLALVAWVVVALARVYGVPVLGQLLNLPPGADLLWTSRYIWPSVAMCVVVLAALGIDDAAQRRVADDGRTVGRLTVSPRALTRAAAVVAAAGVTLALVRYAALTARGNLSADPERAEILPYLRWSVVVAAAVVIVLAVALLLLRHAAARVALAGVLVAEAVAAFVLPQLSAPRSAEIDRTVVAFLQGSTGPSRVYSVASLAPSYGSYYDIPQLNAADPLMPETFVRYVQEELDPDSSAAMFTGVPNGPDGPPPLQDLVDNVEGYRDSAVRYLTTPAGEVLPAGADDLLTPVLRTPTTAVYRLDGAAEYLSTTGACRLELLSRERFTADCTSPARVVRREMHFPGWSATRDGEDVQIREQGPFQAVDLPRGRSEVAFSYAPPGAGLAGVLAAVSAAVVVIDVVLGRGRRRSRSEEKPTAPTGS